jgi:hypothetical protein
MFERAKHFLGTNPDLAVLAHVTRDISSTEGIEVLGTPVGNGRSIKAPVAQTASKSWTIPENFNPAPMVSLTFNW